MTLLLGNPVEEKQLTMEELLSMALQLSYEAKESLKKLESVFSDQCDIPWSNKELTPSDNAGTLSCKQSITSHTELLLMDWALEWNH